MRLDKYLSALDICTRSESRRFAKKWCFVVNGEEITNPGVKIQEWDILYVEWYWEFEAKRNITLRLYKPADYVSSDKPEWNRPSYRDLLADYPYTNLLHVAGRLDVDTEGLLMLTSDGKLNHQIISPKRKLPKVYQLDVKHKISDQSIQKLITWVTLDDGYETLPAECERIGSQRLLLTLHEGKFHQVKRMLHAVNNEVTHLKRLSVGDWTLEGLESGEFDEVQKYVKK